jgi:hypothetical protein
MRARREGPMKRACARTILAILLLGTAPMSRAWADGTDATQRARHEFVAATEYVKDSRWGEALAAFERSSSLRPHALTTYNIGACERALGRYVHARATLKRALAEHAERGSTELPDSFAMQAAEYVNELDGIIAHVDLTISPAEGEVLVDGRPLADSAAHRADASIGVDLDPGVHIFQVTRVGFARAAVSRTLVAGAKDVVRIDLARLPAMLRISANEPNAVVTVSELDVGVAPVDLTRPAGSYAVRVRKPGYVPYTAVVDLEPGADTKLRASLVPESKPLYARWWFWTGAAIVVAGAATTTFFLTRPDPEPPPPDSGGLGWLVPVGR